MGDNNSVNQNPTMQEVTTLIKQWEDKHLDPNYDPIPTLTRLSEICEVETETYLSMDPDPFDERHPSRTDPEGKLGQILKALFRKDNFMNKLVNDYLRDSYYSRLGISGKNVDELNIAACRMMLDVMPGLETSVVFQPDMDSLIHRLIKWTTNSIEPLQSYSTGLLAAAMEIPEIAARFREANGRLIPLLLQRLHRLQSTSDFIVPNNPRPFAHLSGMKSPPYRGDGKIKNSPSPQGAKRAHDNGVAGDEISPMKNQLVPADNADTPTEGSQKKKRKLDVDASPQKALLFTESSNSSWAELKTFMIGSVRIFPPTKALRQILILRYLSPMGEYQEFLSHVFEHEAISLILNYVNVRVTKEARLAFEALRYLAALLCHKKFSIEFLNVDGLEALLEVPRPSIAATGVSICLYYLGYCEDAMERVCLLPKYIITSLVKYALWLLECSHDSGRCHAIMFFSSTFQFKVILEEFDAQDGLRRLHNVIATLPILFQYAEDAPALNDDVEAAARQIMRHVCVAYRRYLEAHLALKVEPIRRSQIRSTGASSQGALPSQPNYKACKFSPEEVQEQIETLLVNLPFRCHWAPVDHLLKLGGLSLLLKIIGFSYEWNYSGRAETVRSALDVLAIACVMPKVQLLICDRVPYRPEDTPAVGMNIILGAAEGEIVTDADVQKSALRVIVNCVCAPIMRVGGTVARFSTSVNSPTKKIKFKSSEELIQKVWDCVRSNNGIMVLLTLMNVKTPITDADSIRTLACKALAGLARSETVRQIVSKLPLFTSGQLQTLMRDPILQEKRQEHVSFQKYALELLERLSGQGHGKPGKDLEVSLSDIHRANVVAQTKIQFNDRQLLQLIHQHLVQKGYSDTASTLVKEANLSNAICQISSTQQPTKFRYTSTLTPSRVKLSFSSPMLHSLPLLRSLPSPTTQPETPNGMNFSSPTIKIIKKNQNQLPTTPIHQNSRLQKQTSSECFPRVASQSILEETNPVVEQPRVSLDSIITEYLTNQHALCKNPMANCPQFNLFIPHKCPDPKPRINTANNFVVRCARRAIGYPCKSMNRKYIHSRFCPVQSIRQTSQDSGFFTTSKFLPDNKSILVGDYNGEVRIFNLNSGNEELMFQAHDNYVVHVEPNRTGEFLLTSSTWGRPLSALWNLKTLDMNLAFQDEDHVEYSKLTQDKILATKLEAATIYDATTGLATLTLTPEGSNQYTKNRATFSPFDDLVLTDGVLFDVASGKQIHKLDKLNQTQSGVFHPNGLEIVSNSEVWDIRTFHLLKTVPALNQCNVIFAPFNNAIYAISMEQEMDDGDTTYESSFKTLDAYDYANIATIDVKRNVYDLAVNKFDTQIAIVENQGVYQSVQESVVRLYDVGRRRDDEDELEDEDEDDEDEMNNETDDDNSDNDDPMVIDLTARPRNRDEDNGNDDDSDISAITSDSDSSWTSVSSDSLSDEL